MIYDLITIMSTTDKEEFQRFLSKRSKRKEGRNIALFKALNKGNEDKLKAELGTNAYHVLKMRLTESLSEFMSARVFEGELTQEAQIIRSLVLARKLLQLEKFETGRKLLHKAEFKASEIQHYSLLNETYHSLIEISHEAPFSEQEVLIQKLEDNTTNFLLQERLNMVFAQVKRAFIESEQGKKQINFDALVQDNFRKYGISISKGYGLKSLYQLATILDYAAAHSRSYHSVNLFFADKIEQLSPEELANERNHLYHIDLLYLLANIHFRQRSFLSSLSYLERMHEQMQAFSGKFYDQRAMKYHLLKALNTNFIGNVKAALTEIERINFTSKEDTLERLQVALTHIMILAQQEKYNEAKSHLSQLYRTDGYYQRIAGIEWVVNRRFLEIILHIESGNVDFAYSRIENLSRQHKDFFNAKANHQIKPFLRVLKHYLNHPSAIETEEFQKFVERTIPWKSSQEDDIFFMSVYGWFKAKMIRKSVYSVTLDLIETKDNQG